MPARYVDFFAGFGGAGTGLRNLGLEHRASLEFDPDACNSLRAAGFLTHERDLRTVHGSEVPKAEIWWASPPCQAFSQSGIRLGRDDPRNGWPWIFRMLRESRFLPRLFVSENVKGMVQHKRKAQCNRGATPKPLDCPACYLEHELVSELRQLFPHVAYRVLNAADYGVPQKRNRVMLIGSFEPIQWPERTHSQVALAHAKWTTGTYWTERGLEPVGEPSRWEKVALRKPDDGLLPWVTVYDALGLRGHLGGMRNTEANPRQERPACHILEQRWRKAGHPELVHEPSNTVAATEYKGTNGKESTGWTAEGGPSRASDTLWLATGRRRLTVEECLVLQDLPRDYPVQGKTKRSRYRQVGNAVPPTLAKVVVEANLPKPHREPVCDGNQMNLLGS